MIVQAIGLLDDLDKELNTYAMRVREWYGWHFPEMTKVWEGAESSICSPYCMPQQNQCYRIIMHKSCILPSWTLQIVADNIQYAKSVKFTGTRDNAAGLDYSGILEEVSHLRIWRRD